MKRLITMLAFGVATALHAAPTELDHGLTVTGGPIIDNGETNATQPWVTDQLAGASGLVAQATAARFARITQPVLEHTLNMTSTWYDVGDGSSTNEDGWSMSGILFTNGMAIYPTNDATVWIQSPLTTNGAALLQVDIADEMNTYVWVVEATNGVLQGELVADGYYQNESNLAVRLGIADPVALRLYFEQFLLPDEVSNYTALASFSVYGWSAPEYVGLTNDHRGMTLLVADATDEQSPPSLSQLTNAIHAVRISMSSADWSTHPSIAPVSLDGHPLRWDSAYSSYTETGALVIAWQNNPIMRMVAGSYAPIVTSIIVSASISDTNITLGVLASTGWRPYPEWSTNSADWTRLATNEFASTYPTQTNGFYYLTFGAVYSDAWYRVQSTNESGGSITGTVDFLSENLTHRGAKIATEPHVEAAVTSALLATRTNNLTLTDGASLIVFPDGGTGGIVLHPTGPTSSPSAPLQMRMTDALSVEYAGSIFLSSNGKLYINLYGYDYEIFTAMGSSYLSVIAFQTWNTNAIKHYIGAPATATSAPPTGVKHALYSSGTNAYLWMPDLGRYGHFGLSTNGGGL